MTMQGKKHSLETRKKMIEAWKHRTPTNLGKKFSKEWRTNISLSLKGKPSSRLGIKLSEETKEKISQNRKGKGMGNQNSKGYKHSKEHTRKSLRRNPKSKLEIKFENIANDLNLPYTFVGNGEVLIGRKCPDFVNTNGKKIAVEVFYTGHKEQFREGVEEWKRTRMETFAEYGWDLKFFNEIEVNEENIMKTLGGV